MSAKHIDDGGPAFPCEHKQMSPGLSTRDYFAAQALPESIIDYDRRTRAGAHGAIDNVLPYATKASGTREQIIARQAYIYADAMLEARKRSAE